MFQVLLAATLALGAGLLASSGSGDAALMSSRSAAQAIGWLCLACALLGARDLRRAGAGQAAAAAIMLFTGASVLYLSYFEWSEASPSPQIAPQVELKTVPPAALPEAPAVVKRAAVRHAVEDPCFLVAGADSLQCKRCVQEDGLRALFCAEQARLDYCGGRHELDSACPSPIPVSLPL
ncbi:MAG: hypothetical protein ACREUS_15325 [Burkholderiales bacterium]